MRREAVAMTTEQLQVSIAVNTIYYWKYSLNAVLANTSTKMEDVLQVASINLG